MNCDITLVTARRTLFAIVCLLLFWSGAAQTANAQRYERASPGRPFSLRVGRELTLPRERLRVRFVDVKEDSRCPANVTCVWAGNASVRIELSTNRRDSQTVTLNTAGNATLPGEVQYRRFRVRLVKLTPYPRSAGKIAQRSYTVTLQVDSVGIEDR
jgi:hypothetical protein